MHAALFSREYNTTHSEYIHIVYSIYKDRLLFHRVRDAVMYSCICHHLVIYNWYIYGAIFMYMMIMVISDYSDYKEHVCRHGAFIQIRSRYTHVAERTAAYMNGTAYTKRSIYYLSIHEL